MFCAVNVCLSAGLLAGWLADWQSGLSILV